MKNQMGKIRIVVQLIAGVLLVVGGLANLPVTLLIILVIYLGLRTPKYVSPEEKATCLKETGNIYCNGPMGD